MPIDHLGLNVHDLEAARAYYDAFMPQVGFEPFVSDERHFSYRVAGGKPGTALFFYRADEAGYSRRDEGLQHLAFRVKTRAEVLDAFLWAMANGGTAIREPQVLDQYHPTYFAAFWQDPHGFLLEVVCHHPPADA